MSNNYHRRHFLSESAHRAVNRYVEITAAYINLFSKPEFNVLDVGGADGIMQDFLRGKVRSIDIFPASERVFEGTIFQEPENTYDLVIYNHVLEHIWSPYEEIGAANKCLKQGGYIFIACPVHNYPWAYEYESHVVLLNENILRKLLLQQGFTVCEYSTHCFRENCVEQWIIAKKN